MTPSDTIPQTTDAAAQRLLTDFTADSADFGWRVVNDNVMGGRSDGGFDVANGVLNFAGSTNTRGGGFSSIRSAPLALDLSAYDGIRVRVRADGRQYTWRLTTHARYYGREVAYWAAFDTEKGDWQDIDIPFSRFVPRFRGSELNGPSLDTGNITGMGLMIYDGRDGAFALALDRVEAYTDGVPFSLQVFRWDRRVLVVSAPKADDAALLKQLGAVEASRAAFNERDLSLVVLSEQGASAAGNRPLSRGEVAELRAQLRIPEDAFALRLIGKDGGVKLSRDASAPMAELYELIDGMPMRRREMTDR